MKRVTVVITIGLIALAIIGSVSILQGNYAIAGSNHPTTKYLVLKHPSSKIDSQGTYSTHDEDDKTKTYSTQDDDNKRMGSAEKKTLAEKNSPEQAYDNLIGKDFIGTKEINSDQSQFKIKSIQPQLKTAKIQPISQSKTRLDPFSTMEIRIQQAKPLIAQIPPSTPTIQSPNPLLDEEEWDITVSNVKQRDILVSLAIDGLKNSTVVPANPPGVTSNKVLVIKFDRHEHANTPAVLPIKLGDEYTACIAFADKKSDGTCLRAGVDSITQPQKKTLDANYIPT